MKICTFHSYGPKIILATTMCCTVLCCLSFFVKSMDSYGLQPYLAIFRRSDVLLLSLYVCLGGLIQVCDSAQS